VGLAHVVWDWNGTLLDDFHLVVAAASASCVEAGGREVTHDEYRTAFTRPVQQFYERVLGRPVSHDDWLAINDVFHTTYRTQMGMAGLAPDAEDALRTVEQLGMSQSLLSMWTHDELVPMVDAFGIAQHFVRIDGQAAPSGGAKLDSLLTHIDHIETALQQGLDRSSILVIGDSTDDASAALEAAVHCVLVASGTHHPEDLAVTGVPVAQSLLEALEMGVRQAQTG
jgi:phosphoglycolate phosphatase-like HAD superfamily hydrolase